MLENQSSTIENLNNENNLISQEELKEISMLRNRDSVKEKLKETEFTESEKKILMKSKDILRSVIQKCLGEKREKTVTGNTNFDLVGLEKNDIFDALLMSKIFLIKKVGGNLSISIDLNHKNIELAFDYIVGKLSRSKRLLLKGIGIDSFHDVEKKMWTSETREINNTKLFLNRILALFQRQIIHDLDGTIIDGKKKVIIDSAFSLTDVDSIIVNKKRLQSSLLTLFEKSQHESVDVSFGLSVAAIRKQLDVGCAKYGGTYKDPLLSRFPNTSRYVKN